MFSNGASELMNDATQRYKRSVTVRTSAIASSECSECSECSEFDWGLECDDKVLVAAFPNRRNAYT